MTERNDDAPDGSPEPQEPSAADEAVPEPAAPAPEPAAPEPAAAEPVAPDPEPEAEPAGPAPEPELEPEPEPEAEPEPESDPSSTTRVPMRATTPGVVRLFGSVIEARSPALTPSAWVGSRSTSTRRSVEVASAIEVPG